MDDLDKTINELEGGGKPKKKKFSAETAFIPKSGAQLLWDEVNGSPPPTEPSTNEVEFKRLLYPNHVATKDPYLPNVLVQLKIFKNNKEAREFIRTNGVMLNGKLTKNCEATNASTNFLLSINGQEYEIFKV